MKIGPGVSELWGVENRPLPLTRHMAYTTACTTVQAVIVMKKKKKKRKYENWRNLYINLHLKEDFGMEFTAC